MARKGNQSKKGIEQTPLKSKKKEQELKVVADESIGGEQNDAFLTDDLNKANPSEDSKKRNKKSKRNQKKDEQMVDPVDAAAPSLHNTCTSADGVPEFGRRGTDKSFVTGEDFKSMNGNINHERKGSDTDLRSEMQFCFSAALERLKSSVLPTVRASCGWLERKKPFLLAMGNRLYRIRDAVQLKLLQTYPIVLKCFFHLGSIVMLVSLLWLDCFIRGINSFLRMGATSAFSVIWLSILSVIAMIGMFKFLLVMAFAAVLGVCVGLVSSLAVVGVCGAISLWFCGSFWTTSFAICLAGLAFILGRERLALSITTAYSLYCAWTYVGWLWVVLGLNLSFISSDLLIYFLRSNIDEQIPKANEGTDGSHGEQNYFNRETHFSKSEMGSTQSADRNAGVASTSGADSEITSENEVIRLLNCTDHYSALGLLRYQQVDVSVLKREYRKKAMLVHPDKNMGNEKAAEAFKKLQNAYEVLLDSLKQKEYDDELRREELLNYFCRFQSASQKNGQHGFFPGGHAGSEGDGEDPLRDCRRMACKKCGSFHLWFKTKKTPVKARWCQDCNDYHQAKDGDGWVEQSSQRLFFGLLQKVELPVAYVCADGGVYDASEWYICQGMRCPANSHKPSFHCNTSLAKNNHGKGSTSAHKSGGFAGPNVEENMTEEEFFEWLQNAMQSGMFENFGGGASSESPQTSTKTGFKSGASSSSGGNSHSKRKKKGKKW